MNASRKSSASPAKVENHPPSASPGRPSPGAPPTEPGHGRFEWGRILLFFALAIPLVVAVLLKDACG